MPKHLRSYVARTECRECHLSIEIAIRRTEANELMRDIEIGQVPTKALCDHARPSPSQCPYGPCGGRAGYWGYFSSVLPSSRFPLAATACVCTKSRWRKGRLSVRTPTELLVRPESTSRSKSRAVMASHRPQ